MIVALVLSFVAGGPGMLAAGPGRTAERGPSDGSNKENILSSAAVVCILFFIVDLYMQHKSHAYLYDEELQEVYEESSDWKTRTTQSALSVWVNIVLTIICLVFLALCCDSLVVGMKDQAPTTKALLALFIIPVASHLAGFGEALVLSYRNYSDRVLVSTLSGVRCLLLFVQPVLLLASLTSGWGNYAGFDLMQIILVGILLWVFSTIIGNGKANYLDGILLLAL
jgi:calcium/proton exchanger cax